MSLAINRWLICKGIQFNSTDEHPALVTRVWNEDCVNVTVFLDAGPMASRTSVRVCKTREEAQAILDQGNEVAAFWSPRV